MYTGKITFPKDETISIILEKRILLDRVYFKSSSSTIVCKYIKINFPPNRELQKAPSYYHDHSFVFFPR